MSKRLLVAPMILSVASLFTATDSAFAQRGGHGGGGGHAGGGHAGGGHAGGGYAGGGHAGGGYAGGGHAVSHVGGGHYNGNAGGGHYAGNVGGGRNVGHVGANGRGYGGGYGGGHYGDGYGRSYFGRGYYNGANGYYPGYLGSYYYPGYDTNSWSSAYPDYAYPDYSSYAAPASPYFESPTQFAATPATTTADSASIRVIVPDSQAQVWFDGTGTNQAGTDRLFHTPSLTIGSSYTYHIRATWMQNGRQMTQERTVAVTPGQMTLVNFTR